MNDQNKLYWNINSLTAWDKNPRTIDDKAFSSLKAKINRWGQFKPLIITPDGVVIGGNMRLKAMKELGITDIWVSVVEPKSEAELLEIAMADNELSGRWERDELKELLSEHQDEINLADYELDLGEPISMSDLLKESDLKPEPVEDEESESEDEHKGQEKLTCPQCGTEWYRPVS